MIGRDKDATWRTTATLCRELDWGRQRLIYELENGLPSRTVPPGRVIDWRDPRMQRGLNVETSELSFSRRWRGPGSPPTMLSSSSAPAG